MTNYSAFMKRIDRATTRMDCVKLWNALDRLWGTGALSVYECQILDLKLVQQGDKITRQNATHPITL